MSPRSTPTTPVLFAENSALHAGRFKHQFDQLVEHTQWAMREGEARRAELWKKPGLDLSNWFFPLAKASAAAIKKYK
ncbi:MAG: hypothetical protein N2689_04155, partial [Verrucomicrobiae bacterium]|nr:hypothetical protein [Verrucomicrobiae bacterium]